MTTDDNIVERARAAATGHVWGEWLNNPSRMLHDLANEIERLRADADKKYEDAFNIGYEEATEYYIEILEKQGMVLREAFELLNEKGKQPC